MPRLVQYLTLAILLCGFSGLSEGAPKKKKKGSQTSGAPDIARERNIVREARSKKGERKIDFSETDISAAPKTPLGSLVNQNKIDRDHDFIRPRTDWRPEMVQSASSLEAGRAR